MVPHNRASRPQRAGALGKAGCCGVLPKGSAPPHLLSLTIGELLLNVVYTHCIFENPGVGIFQQLTGWAMGTNAAPTWSTLVLRFYERLKLHLHPSIKLMRFIDDGLMFHPKNMEPSLDSLLKSIYPPHLTFDILQRGLVAHVPFLDVLFITLHPLRHSVY